MYSTNPYPKNKVHSHKIQNTQASSLQEMCTLIESIQSQVRNKLCVFSVQWCDLKIRLWERRFKSYPTNLSQYGVVLNNRESVQHVPAKVRRKCHIICECFLPGLQNETKHVYCHIFDRHNLPVDQFLAYLPTCISSSTQWKGRMNVSAADGMSTVEQQHDNEFLRT